MFCVPPNMGGFGGQYTPISVSRHHLGTPPNPHSLGSRRSNGELYARVPAWQRGVGDWRYPQNGSSTTGYPLWTGRHQSDLPLKSRVNGLFGVVTFKGVWRGSDPREAPQIPPKTGCAHTPTTTSQGVGVNTCLTEWNHGVQAGSPIV